MRNLIKAGAVALALLLGTAWSSQAVAHDGWYDYGRYRAPYHHGHHVHHGYPWYGYTGYYRPGVTVYVVPAPNRPYVGDYTYYPGYWSYRPWY